MRGKTRKPRLYTVERYAPAYPETGVHVRVHLGSFEVNRDSLSPSMIDAREITAANAVLARWIYRQQMTDSTGGE